MTDEEEKLRDKIISVLNKNFTEDVEVTPVYTREDGLQIELPQELCEMFNDIVTQAVIPYFADALIAAGLKFDVSYSFTAAFNSVQAERERDLEHKLTAAEHRAEVAERALENACVVILSSRNGDQPRRLRAYYKAYLKQAEKEFAEERK